MRTFSALVGYLRHAVSVVQQTRRFTVVIRALEAVSMQRGHGKHRDAAGPADRRLAQVLVKPQVVAGHSDSVARFGVTEIRWLMRVG
jgi:hypothetical protein